MNCYYYEILRGLVNKLEGYEKLVKQFIVHILLANKYYCRKLFYISKQFIIQKIIRNLYKFFFYKIIQNREKNYLKN